MGRPAVFVTRAIPEEGMRLLGQECEVVVHGEDRVCTREELIQGLAGKDGLLCLLTDTIDEAVIASNPRLLAISNYAVGYNNIEVAAATRRGIPVCNTPGVLTETTADLTWALILAVARRIVEGDAMVRAGRFKGWAPLLLLGTEVYGKTLGIVGFGRIGQAVARRARGFGMRVLYHGRTRRSEREEEELGAVYAPLNRLLAESDFISIHVPLTADTRHLIGERELARMRPTAYLINTARGPIVDERALVAALQAGRIGGAGLDTFEDEPALAPGLADLPNVVLLPHVGSATRETRGRMAEMAADNLVRALRGERPRHVVNPEVYAAP